MVNALMARGIHPRGQRVVAVVSHRFPPRAARVLTDFFFETCEVSEFAVDKAGSCAGGDGANATRLVVLVGDCTVTDVVAVVDGAVRESAAQIVRAGLDSIIRYIPLFCYIARRW